jgi:hypothetical protein
MLACPRDRYLYIISKKPGWRCRTTDKSLFPRCDLQLSPKFAQLRYKQLIDFFVNTKSVFISPPPIKALDVVHPN